MKDYPEVAEVLVTGIRGQIKFLTTLIKDLLRFPFLEASLDPRFPVADSNLVF
jgi:hypothetical protein